MRKLLNFLPLAMVVGLSGLAEEDSKPTPVPEGGAGTTDIIKAEPGAWQRVRDWKAQQFQDVLTKAGVDQAASEKIFANFKVIKEEKKAEYKKMKDAFKEKSLKALTDAGLTPEKAQEVMTKYKERTSEVKKAIEAGIKPFFEKMKGAEGAGTP